MINIIYTIIIYPITQIIEFVFVFAQKLFRETGLSIICVSGAVSILCLPLYMVAEKWQNIERDTQKRLEPKITKIKTVFKGDERYMILSAYYRQNHYHPVYAMRSTFGLLIQIPFFIAAYTYLSHLDVLNGASFLFIRDLGKPDRLLPIAGGINLLPLLMTLINCTAGIIYARGLGIRDKIQLYGISIIFLVLLYNSPSALVLYWTLNNVFSLAKNIYLKISLPSKRIIIYVFVSALCTLLILFSLFILRRDAGKRITISSLFLCIGLIPWILPLLKKLTKNVSCIEYTARDSLFIFLFSFLSVGVLTGIFLPSMLIVSSPQEFSHIDTYGSPLFFIANTALQTFGFYVFWPTCLYFLFRGKRNIFAAVGMLFLAASICNVFLFPGNYGLISIEMIFDKGVGHNLRSIMTNLTALCAVFTAVLFIFLRGGAKVTFPVILLPFIAVFGISMVNMVRIQREFQKTQEYYTEKQTPASIEPIFQFSKTGKNTVIIMLDRATSAFIPYILAESPDIAGIFSGFIYYPNTVSFNGYTRLGAPPLFGGYEYSPKGMNSRPDISMREKHNESLLLMPVIFSEADYDVTITDPPYPNYSYKDDLRIYDSFSGINAYITIGEYTDYWLREHKMTLPSRSDVLKRNIFWYSLMKIMPFVFRNGIYQLGGWFAPFSGYKFISNIDSYSVLDYLPRLTGFQPKSNNSFLLISNNTTHEGLFYQAPEYRPQINITDYGKSPYGKENEYHTNIGALKRLGEWFEFLKSENSYDNTRIIIVSDHGAQQNYVLKTNLPFNLDNVNPLLLFKDFNDDGPLKTDFSFMSNADVPFLAFKDQIENACNPWTGNPINVDAKNNPLYIAFSGGIHLEDPNETLLSLDDKRNYYIHDNIFDDNNWIPAEN